MSIDTDDRSNFIGGSDVAAILGISPWASPWSVWAEKTGLVQPTHSDEHEERMEIGKDAERFLADVFNRHHAKAGCEVRPDQAELRNDAWPWLRGHADGMVVGTSEVDGTPGGGWEAKTARDFKPWDEIPAYYQAQAQTYMMLSGHESWWFTVGFAGWKVKHYVVLADPDDQALIAKATETFWNDHVVTGVAPEVDGTDATTAAISAAYGHLADAADTMLADADALCEVDELRYWRAEAKVIDGRVSELENRLKDRLRDCAVLVDSRGVPLITWRPATSKRVDLELLRSNHPDVATECTVASVSRRFLVKPAKGE